MKVFSRLSPTASIALMGLLFLPFTYAQRGPGPGQPTRMYNPANETTVKGTIEEVKTVPGRHGWNGTHLTLRVKNDVTDVHENIDKGKVVSEETTKQGRTVDVHLGPSTFLKDKGISFSKGDQIEVTGATAKLGDSEALIAREVRKGDKTLVLRDTQGFPKWSGGWNR